MMKKTLKEIRKDIKEITEEFDGRYDSNNPILLKGIRKLLRTPAGVLLIAGQIEWLEEKLEDYLKKEEGK